MTAEQITGMQADELLLLVGNRNPLRAKQNLYFKSKAYRGRFDQNPLADGLMPILSCVSLVEPSSDEAEVQPCG